MALSRDSGHSIIPDGHEIGRNAMRRVEEKLAPCIVTKLSEGDDYFLDGFVQHVSREQVLTHTSLVFTVQSKGIGVSLKSSHSEPLRVKHLRKWSASNVEVIVAVTSISDNEARWRFVRDIIRELDSTKTGWREKSDDSKISVRFTKSDARDGKALHDWIETKLSQFTDRDGGKSRPHSSVRSVLITDLYHRDAYNGQRLNLSKDKHGNDIVGNLIVGPQWLEGELDPTFLEPYRILSGALLLFEKVFFPLDQIFAVAEALRPNVLLRLILSERIIPVSLRDRDLAFVSSADTPTKGDLYYTLTDLREVQTRNLEAIRRKYRLQKSFVTQILGKTRWVSPNTTLENELVDVSKLQQVRELLGLGMPRPRSQESIWSAERLLRIGQVVNLYYIARELSIDVVEFEPGLSRVALSRWGSKLSFHRVYEAIDVLESTFRASALPDVGSVAKEIGMIKCVEIAQTKDAQAFRDWFWNHATTAIEDRNSFDSEFIARICELAKAQKPLPKEFYAATSEIGVGNFEGWASRPGVDQSLLLQTLGGETRLRNAIRKFEIPLPALNDPCICGEDALFEECCGRVFWQPHPDFVEFFYKGSPPKVKR